MYGGSSHMPSCLTVIRTVPGNPTVKFYYDSNYYSDYPQPVYTNEPIPPQSISVIAREDNEKSNFKN